MDVLRIAVCIIPPESSEIAHLLVQMLSITGNIERAGSSRRR